MTERDRIVAGAKVSVFPDKPTLVREATTELAELAARAVQERGRFFIALSGGSTPAALYRALAGLADPMPWDRIEVFFGDERPVPPAHPDSNYRMAHETLLGQVAIPADNVHRIEAERGPAEAAEAYEAELRRVFQLAPGQWPRFDLVLLGLGPDAHTASLFPGTTALAETERLVVANYVPRLDTTRITMTAPVLNAAQQVWFIATGDEKTDPVKRVLEGDEPIEQAPARLLRADGERVRWWLDAAAAAGL